MFNAGFEAHKIGKMHVNEGEQSQVATHQYEHEPIRMAWNWY